MQYRVYVRTELRILKTKLANVMSIREQTMGLPLIQINTIVVRS